MSLDHWGQPDLTVLSERLQVQGVIYYPGFEVRVMYNQSAGFFLLGFGLEFW